MGKGADMSWEDIQNEFDIMNRMSCRPVGLQKVPGNHIFDEDQSVKSVSYTHLTLPTICSV